MKSHTRASHIKTVSVTRFVYCIRVVAYHRPEEGQVEDVVVLFVLKSI